MCVRCPQGSRYLGRRKERSNSKLPQRPAASAPNRERSGPIKAPMNKNVMSMHLKFCDGGNPTRRIYCCGKLFLLFFLITLYLFVFSLSMPFFRPYELKIATKSSGYTTFCIYFMYRKRFVNIFIYNSDLYWKEKS